MGMAAGPLCKREQRLLLAARLGAWLAVIAAVAIFARNLRLRAVFAALSEADAGMLLAAMALWLPAAALQGSRWYALVRAVRPAPFFTVLAAAYVGFAASAVLPMRAGEAVRAELLARSTGMGRAMALGTLAIDHTVNGVVMFLGAAALPWLLPLPLWSRLALWGGAGFAFALVAVMLRLARRPSLRPAPVSWLRQTITRLRGGLVGLRRPRSVAGALACSGGAWALEVATTAMALRAFHLPHGVADAMGILLGVNLALAIPSPPANLGSFELGAGFALVALGGPTDHAAAFALGFHAIQLFPTLLAGVVALPRFRRKQLAGAAHIAAHPLEIAEVDDSAGPTRPGGDLQASPSTRR